jgi:drug/metabolite transporter (DMT)-like permease
VSFFTALVEPLVFRRRIDPGELVIGGLVVIGATLLIQVGFAPEPAGLALGLASAVFAAVFGVLNGKLASHERPDRLMFYEMSAAAVIVSVGVIVLSRAQMVAPWNLSTSDTIWLAVLSLACTVVPQVWIIHVLRALSPFTVAITVNLEPVYSLILAAVLFPHDRPPSPSFYAGAALVFGLVILDGVRKSRSRGAHAP